MVPLIKEFQKYPNIFNIKVCVTAQHREMLDQVLHLFKITPDYDMNIMKSGQDLYDITSNVLLKMKSVLEEYQPDLVFVHGEHVLRRGTGGFLSADTRRPSGGRAAHRRHLLPLARRGQPPAHYADHRLPLRLHGDLENHPPQRERRRPKDRRHRPPQENHGQGFFNICTALKEIALTNSDIHIVYLNPNIQKPVKELLSGIDNVYLIEPLQYKEFIYLMDRSYFIITDNGDVQEEAPSLGKPVLVMRDTTEHPEALEAGTVKLVGKDTELIIKEAQILIENIEKHTREWQKLIILMVMVIQVKKWYITLSI